MVGRFSTVDGALEERRSSAVVRGGQEDPARVRRHSCNPSFRPHLRIGIDDPSWSAHLDLRPLPALRPWLGWTVPQWSRAWRTA